MASDIILDDQIKMVLLAGNQYLLVGSNGVLRNNNHTVTIGGLGNTIDNLGLIFSATNAVFLDDALSGVGLSVDILNTGTMIGEASGITGTDFGAVTLRNSGTIRGGDRGVWLVDSGGALDTVFIVNDGSITGADYGVLIENASVRQFVNTGTIAASNTYGVLLQGLEGETLVVNSGVMAGSFAFAGATLVGAPVTLVNTGTLAGLVDFGEAPDLFDGRGGITTAAVLMGLGDDTLHAGSGAGRFDGQEGNDLLFGSASGNEMLGGANDDTLLGGAGDDNLQGGAGLDEIDGGEGNDLVRGGAGADVLEGGLGRDLLDYGGSLGVNVNLATGEGLGGDATGDSFAGFENIAGGSGRDTLSGDAFANTLYGRGFDDLLLGAAGNDYLLGQDGNDTLDGGLGADILRGGSGLDRFRLLAPGHSPNTAGQRDRVLDFVRAEGDRIDLSFIDANTTAAGNQAFTFGAGAFTAAGQVRVSAQGAGTYLVLGNTDGVVTTTEFALVVTAANALAAGDFVL
jgi:Ca2+-binding RTX toxin-like protein